MKLYVKSLLLIFGALLLTNCASHRSEVTQDASASTSFEKKIVADGLSDQSALAEVRPEHRDDEIVCKTETSIGSRVPQKEVCATRKQWSDRVESPRAQWKKRLARPKYSS